MVVDAVPAKATETKKQKKKEEETITRVVCAGEVLKEVKFSFYLGLCTVLGVLLTYGSFFLGGFFPIILPAPFIGFGMVGVYKSKIRRQQLEAKYNVR